MSTGHLSNSLSGVRWISVFAIIVMILATKYHKIQLRGPFFPLLDSGLHKL